MGIHKSVNGGTNNDATGMQHLVAELSGERGLLNRDKPVVRIVALVERVQAQRPRDHERIAAPGEFPKTRVELLGRKASKLLGCDASPAGDPYAVLHCLVVLKPAPTRCSTISVVILVRVLSASNAPAIRRPQHDDFRARLVPVDTTEGLLAHAGRRPNWRENTTTQSLSLGRINRTNPKYKRPVAVRDEIHRVVRSVRLEPAQELGKF
jgi:hypothetical protein